MLDHRLPIPSIQEAPVQRRHVSADLFVVLLITVCTFSLSAAFELREWLTEATHPLERYQIDELPLTFAALALSLAWFSWRRWRESEEELNLRVEAQRALVEREDQYRTLFMENLTGNALADGDGTLLLCNPAMARMLGLRGVEHASAFKLGEFYADQGLWERHREALGRGEKLEIDLLELVATDNASVKAIARIIPRHTPGKSVRLQAYFADITEQQLMHAKLAGALAENRSLSQKYLQVQEDERRGLARELHDEMGQCLNAIKLDAVAIRNQGKQLSAEVVERAQAIIDVSSRVYDVARGLMERLRPVALDELGLADALRHLVDEWRRRNRDIACALDVPDALNDLGEQINITMYRMVQECLTNVTRHAQASSVRIRVSRSHSPPEILVTVADDGRGLERKPGHGGLGLVGLRERVEGLGGKLETVAVVPHGTEVRVRIELRATEPAPERIG